MVLLHISLKAPEVYRDNLSNYSFVVDMEARCLFKIGMEGSVLARK